MRCLRLWLAGLVGSSFVALVQGQSIVDTPVFVPVSPAVGQTVNVEVHGYACVLYLTPPDTPYDVMRNGGAVTLTVRAVVSPDQDFCIYPTQTELYSIGSFLPGHYTVTVRAQYTNFFNQPITQTLGTLEFTVQAPERVPTLSGWGQFLLVLSLGAAVWIPANRCGLSSS